MTLSESHQPTKQILWILNVIIQDLIQVFYIFPFYIFFCSFFPCFHLFFLMTSLRYCNVMNYFNGSYTVISYSYGFMEFCPFFFSVSRHHNQPYSSQQRHKPQSGSFFLSSFSAPPSRPTSIVHLFSVRPSGQVHVKLTSSSQRPLEFVWTASSSSMLIEKGWKLPHHLKHPSPPPQMSSDRWWQVITLEGGIMWLSREEGPPLIAVRHVCSHTPAHTSKD